MIKQKKLLTTILTVSSLALVGVGFSTWFVGFNEVNKEVGLSVLVDSKADTSCILDVAVSDDEKVFIAEQYAEPEISNGKINNIIATSNESDLDINFTNFEVAIANETYSNVDKILVKVERLEIGNSSSATNIKDIKRTFSADDVDRFNRSGDLTYLVMQEEISLAELNNTTYFSKNTNYLGSYTYYKSTNFKLSFSWGSLWNNTSPASYYDENITLEEGKTTEALEKLNCAQKDLAALQDEFGITADKYQLKVSLELKTIKK